ncbi:bacteriophage protein [Pectobacterium carotovorum subsp. carotovorum]|nr:bacteriophage protein [Pectobacterium carotovorum subsp. carotovorum]
MIHKKLVIFVFAGRKKFLDIQKEYILDIMKHHNNVEYHLWNFSRNSDDNNYLQSLSKEIPNTSIFNQFYEGENPVKICQKEIGVICNCEKCRVGKWSEPYKFYSNSDNYKDAVFMKLDDDILFIESKKITSVVEIASKNNKKIISANVINNGVCAKFDNELKEEIVLRKLVSKERDLLSWWYLCTEKSFFQLSHSYFFKRMDILRKNKIKLSKVSKKRFSINTLLFTSYSMKLIASKLSEQPHDSMNDEFVISTNFPIYIMNNFISCHCHFADQRSQLTDEEENQILAQYHSLSKNCL